MKHNRKWGSMTGFQVSETVMADLEKFYYSRYGAPFKVLGATEIHGITPEHDCFGVSLLYRGCIERRYVQISKLYS